MKRHYSKGIVERMAEAKTPEEVQELRLSPQYLKASSKTQRRANRKALYQP